MWIAMNDGVISAIQHDRDPAMLVVRARNPDHLRAIFPGRRVHRRAGSDYAARVLLTKEEFPELLARRARGIGYPNFKNSVADAKLHRMYEQMWLAGWNYQRDLEAGEASPLAYRPS
jgi:hypothetical protein